MKAALLLGAGLAASGGHAQQAAPQPDARTIMVNAARFAGVDREPCGTPDASGDIIVCAPRGDQTLPVPELYAPEAGSSDGAAVDPRGLPCGAGPAGCYVGVGLPALARALAGGIASLIDPDRDLGEGDPIPARFRGANR